jgi:hypothetical protein
VRVFYFPLVTKALTRFARAVKPLAPSLSAPITYRKLNARAIEFCALTRGLGNFSNRKRIVPYADDLIRRIIRVGTGLGLLFATPLFAFDSKGGEHEHDALLVADANNKIVGNLVSQDTVARYINGAWVSILSYPNGFSPNGSPNGSVLTYLFQSSNCSGTKYMNADLPTSGITVTSTNKTQLIFAGGPYQYLKVSSGFNAQDGCYPFTPPPTVVVGPAQFVNVDDFKLDASIKRLCSV